MDFNLDIKEKGPSRVTPVSVAVSEEMKEDLKRIKKSSDRNCRLVNELTRQFWAQIIEKFDSGEFDSESD